MNKVYLIGNLTRDPELLTTPNGIAYCKFTVAVSRRFSKDETDFFPVVVWRAQAENCAKYLNKGNKVAISGSIQMRTYDKDGEKRYATDIVADEVEFLSPKGSGEAFDEGYASQRVQQVSQLQPVDNDDELPF